MERTIPFALPTLHDIRVRLETVLAPRGANTRRPHLDDGTIRDLIVLLTALLQPSPDAPPYAVPWPIPEAVEAFRARMNDRPEAFRVWDREDLAALCDQLLMTHEKLIFQAHLAVRAAQGAPVVPAPTPDSLLATAIRAAAVALAFRMERDQPAMIHALRVANACVDPGAKLAALLRYAVEFSPAEVNWLDFPEEVRHAAVRLVKAPGQSPMSYIVQAALNRTAAEVLLLDIRDMLAHPDLYPDEERAAMSAGGQVTIDYLTARYPDLPA